MFHSHLLSKGQSPHLVQTAHGAHFTRYRCLVSLFAKADRSCIPPLRSCTRPTQVRPGQQREEDTGCVTQLDAPLWKHRSDRPAPLTRFSHRLIIHLFFTRFGICEGDKWNLSQLRSLRIAAERPSPTLSVWLYHPFPWLLLGLLHYVSNTCDFLSFSRPFFHHQLLPPVTQYSLNLLALRGPPCQLRHPLAVFLSKRLRAFLVQAPMLGEIPLSCPLIHFTVLLEMLPWKTVFKT